jgi:hypothetical protein
MSAEERKALLDKLSRLWNPDCQDATAKGIRVRIQLTPEGYLKSPPELANAKEIEASADPALTVNAQRAMSAIQRGQPYTDVLRPQHYADWRDLWVNFNAKQACGKL